MKAFTVVNTIRLAISSHKLKHGWGYGIN